jgi:acetyl-CoA acetyltransferase
MTFDLPPGPAFVVGIGETEYRRPGGAEHGEFELACLAIQAAARDAGIETRDIDGIVSFADPAGDVSVLQLALGIPELRHASMAWGGRGGAGCAAIALAANAVRCGQASVVAVVRSISQGRTRRYGKFFSGREHANFTAPFGLLSPAQMMAPALQRYAFVHGVDLGESMLAIAQACRDNAQGNPRALLRGRPLTREEYQASRRIADPLRLPDCCLESDGACALIVADAAAAARLARTPVEIAAAVQHGEAGWSTGYMGAHNMPKDQYGLTGGQRGLARRLYAQAGVSPQEIDVAQIYDHFTGMVLLALEDFGFCGPGEAPRFICEGGIARGGALPINTAGGSLAEAYVHGLNHAIEGVRQMRGESACQVPDARTCLVTSGSGIMPTSALILRRRDSN